MYIYIYEYTNVYKIRINRLYTYMVTHIIGIDVIIAYIRLISYIRLHIRMYARLGLFAKLIWVSSIASHI